MSQTSTRSVAACSCGGAPGVRPDRLVRADCCWGFGRGSRWCRESDGRESDREREDDEPFHSDLPRGVGAGRTGPRPDLHERSVLSCPNGVRIHRRSDCAALRWDTPGVRSIFWCCRGLILDSLTVSAGRSGRWWRSLSLAAAHPISPVMVSPRVCSRCYRLPCCRGLGSVPGPADDSCYPDPVHGGSLRRLGRPDPAAAVRDRGQRGGRRRPAGRPSPGAAPRGALRGCRGLDPAASTVPVDDRDLPHRIASVADVPVTHVEGNAGPSL